MGTRTQSYVYIEYKGKRILIITVYWHWDGYDHLGEFDTFLKRLRHKGLTVKQFQKLIYNKCKGMSYLDDDTGDIEVIEEPIKRSVINKEFACDTEADADYVYKIEDTDVELNMNTFFKSDGHHGWRGLISENPFYYKCENNDIKKDIMMPEEVEQFVLL